MALLDDYRRVTRAYPCGICGHGGWCMASRDSLERPSSYICARIQSDKPRGDAGWLHQVKDEPVIREARLDQEMVTIHRKAEDLFDPHPIKPRR